MVDGAVTALWPYTHTDVCVRKDIETERYSDKKKVRERERTVCIV